MLVDVGGLPGGRFDIGARVVTPFLLHEWVGTLDVLALTHPQADHIAGAPAILRGFSIGEVWSVDAPGPSATFLWVQEYLRERRIPHRILSAGSPPVRWGDATIETLHPRSGTMRIAQGAAGAASSSRSNDASLVLRIGIGDQAALLTGDIEREGEAALLREGGVIRAQVLKVPHHGSRTSSAAAFLAAVRPEVALVSVGYRNRFNHPHLEVVERYRAQGIRLLRTDLNGALSVEMTPDGIRAWGRSEAPE
ncbi:MAG: MBL fold metallo-hydrolase [candidate division NC10 bacterium]|nr:MBL fold metallo-hydrolase [candidate division NC10 bacterium]